MNLSDAYSVSAGKLPELFNKIKDGQAPEIFTQQLLKDWGFSSSNDRASIPILKKLGFLSPDGKPTSRYHDFRNHSQSKKIMGEALKDAYHDIFLIKEKPTQSDVQAITGKFKSYHNVTDHVASCMARTFLVLLELADISTSNNNVMQEKDNSEENNKITSDTILNQEPKFRTPAGLHYNIQIHLPATKDVEVYNSIFKSIKEHLFDE